MAITQMNQIYKVLMDPGSRFLQVITHNYVLHNQITNRNEGGGRLSVKIQIFDLNQLSIYSIIFHIDLSGTVVTPCTRVAMFND